MLKLKKGCLFGDSPSTKNGGGGYTTRASPEDKGSLGGTESMPKQHSMACYPIPSHGSVISSGGVDT